MANSTADLETIWAYDADASGFAEEWEHQPAGTDLHKAVTRFFTLGPTADNGCGSGRDTAWLTERGYPAVGFDASSGLLAEARRRHPGIVFQQSLLPALEGIAPASFTNVLCETVIMHLPMASIEAAVTRLCEILVPGGTLYLTWRVTQGADRRDDHARLYTAFDPALVHRAVEGMRVLIDEEVDSASSGKVIRRLVLRN